MSPHFLFSFDLHTVYHPKIVRKEKLQLGHKKTLINYEYLYARRRN
jgi:hypothetical protein